MSIIKMRLPVVKLDRSGGQRTRNILIDLNGMGVDSWYDHNSDSPTLGHCKVMSNGETYKVALEQKVLESKLEEYGVKIIEGVVKK